MTLSNDSERDALLNVEKAAREVDKCFDPKDAGPQVGWKWWFGGRLVSVEASEALLSLHDYLNDVTNARTPALPEERHA